jgi:hypothetical protein
MRERKKILSKICFFLLVIFIGIPVVSLNLEFLMHPVSFVPILEQGQETLVRMKTLSSIQGMLQHTLKWRRKCHCKEFDDVRGTE